MADLRPHSLLTSRLGIMDKSLYGRGEQIAGIAGGLHGMDRSFMHYDIVQFPSNEKKA